MIPRRASGCQMGATGRIDSMTISWKSGPRTTTNVLHRRERRHEVLGTQHSERRGGRSNPTALSSMTYRNRGRFPSKTLFWCDVGGRLGHDGVLLSRPVKVGVTPFTTHQVDLTPTIRPASARHLHERSP